MLYWYGSGNVFDGNVRGCWTDKRPLTDAEWEKKFEEERAARSKANAKKIREEREAAFRKKYSTENAFEKTRKNYEARQQRKQTARDIVRLIEISKDPEKLAFIKKDLGLEPYGAMDIGESSKEGGSLNAEA